MSESRGRCPACGQPLYGWVTVPAEDGSGCVIDRCEACGLGVSAAGEPLDADGELRKLTDPDPDEAGSLWLRTPNRASLQAGIGAQHWAGLDPTQRLHLTPRSLELLAERAGWRVERIGSPPLSRNQRWMWQTLLNAFTLRDNFARDALAGRLRPSRGTERLRFGIDAMVSVLAALPVALISLPLELLAALVGRGGELAATLRASR